MKLRLGEINSAGTFYGEVGLATYVFGNSMMDRL
jgi:hypothetical protein